LLASSVKIKSNFEVSSLALYIYSLWKRGSFNLEPAWPQEMELSAYIFYVLQESEGSYEKAPA